MNVIRSILWLLSGGLLSFAAWIITALLCFLTLVGIPAAAVCIKLAFLSLNPFRKTVAFRVSFLSIIANYIWLSIRIPTIFLNFILGILLTLTIIGIPFAREHFKIAKIALVPFGTRIS